ncbi:class F sortase [Pseudonocardia sp. KRD-184]|uniref:Class F sortase n=1 Tax=Pseudonocardia oceani TaxID=2792013 RepID=A0ABS6U6A5_9PSEU|nr:class F sortase [Pseudonocardia oceani]MBW0094358.1 class F sortase [Pseudonocardia oceani]MBW0100792.1 class F sortase [Pseudonocardia oceani]MBW0113625.1 class F sortase [Pseudonocardia oceani]MBW0127772.1 class F sortase [Pseudonocardia oceani]
MTRAAALLCLALALLAGCAAGPVAAPEVPAPAAARPVALDVPVLGVHTPLLSLGLQPDGTVEVPPLDDVGTAGWYRHSPVPGGVGPAVLLGHVDSARDGPGVFAGLTRLRPGDAVSVVLDDGTTAAFRVDRVESFAKDAFPTQQVYGDLDHPGLRLITCGGTFDEERRSYRDNVVVFASGAP